MCYIRLYPHFPFREWGRPLLCTQECGKMNRLSISSAACGNRVAAAFEKARWYGNEFDVKIDVEIVPWSWTKYGLLRSLEQEYNVRVRSLHGAMWMVNKYRDTVRNDKMKGLEAVVARMFAGTVETNPGILIAGLLKVPLVLHAGVWFEIQRLEQKPRDEMIGRLRDLPAGITWESAWNFHPWCPAQNEGLLAATAANDQAAEAGIKSSITLDTSHLPRLMRNYSVEDALYVAAETLQDYTVFQIHLSDVLRGLTATEDMQHLELGLGEMNLAKTVGFCAQQWPDASLTLETMFDRFDFVRPHKSVKPLDRSIRALMPLLQQ